MISCVYSFVRSFIHSFAEWTMIQCARLFCLARYYRGRLASTLDGEDVNIIIWLRVALATSQSIAILANRHAACYPVRDTLSCAFQKHNPHKFSAY